MHDESLWHTAMRETREELGLPESGMQYIMELPKYVTPSEFEVTPFLAFIHSDLEFTPCPHEVDSVIKVPISHLLDSNNLNFEQLSHAGKEYNLPFYIFEDHKIWGMTGKIILNLLKNWEK